MSTITMVEYDHRAQHKYVQHAAPVQPPQRDLVQHMKPRYQAWDEHGQLLGTFISERLAWKLVGLTGEVVDLDPTKPHA